MAQSGDDQLALFIGEPESYVDDFRTSLQPGGPYTTRTNVPTSRPGPGPMSPQSTGVEPNRHGAKADPTAGRANAEVRRMRGLGEPWPVDD
jgi:hypothetical protein